MSKNNEIAHQYLKFLREADLRSIKKLFAIDAIVHSPVYGVMPAHRFYEILCKDTVSSILELKGIFEEGETNRIAIYFSYTWVLVHKKTVTFDVVDIITLNELGLITDLKIIYDTVQSRAFVEELRK